MCVYISESLEEAEGMWQDGHGADGVLWFRGDGRQEHGWFPIISRAIPQVAVELEHQRHELGTAPAIGQEV